jgi:putative glycosyltransferase (TIGR04348 family)
VGGFGYASKCSLNREIVKIALITPALQRARNGNSHTSSRWAAMLRALGHRVSVATVWNGEPVDAMLALHARRSHDSIKRFAVTHPDRPLIVALTGTDLYRDIRVDADAKQSMQLATRMIVLQEMGLKELTPSLVKKTRVIYQSAEPLASRAPLKTCFEVTVIGHLREEKDPLRAALALKHLSPNSNIRVTQLGRSLDNDITRAAQAIMAEEPRHHWLGEVPHWKARRYLARSRVMVISSCMEGGPVIASKMSGNIGMLGKDYSGYYPVGNERALAKLLHRAETDREFYSELKCQCRARKKLITAAGEKRALASLLSEFRTGK